MKSLTRASSDSPCRLSWLLVEVDEGPKAEYFAIHSVEVIGDCNDAYVSRIVRFSLERSERSGVIRLASDDLKTIESERRRLLSNQEQKSNQIEKALKADLWCLVRQTTDESKIRLVLVNCKKLTCIESPDKNRKKFLMQQGPLQVPTTLLHIIDSEKQLLDEMSFLNDLFAQNFICEEKDREIELCGLQEAYFLVQYFEDAANLIYTIVQYKDTVWKEKNLFPNVVAYVTNGKTVSQCVVLRKSYDITELRGCLTQIKETCDNLDYPLLHAQLKKSAIKTKDSERAY